MGRGNTKYVGDSIMAIYGAPISYQDDILRAIRTALDTQSAFNALREGWADEQERGLGLGIGIHTGEAVVGNIGTETLMDYTVIGDAVNIAARLEELAQGGQILIAQKRIKRSGDGPRLEPMARRCCADDKKRQSSMS